MIKVENLDVYIDGKQIVKSVNFTNNLGECTAILGHNGSGKSTLINTLAGVYKYQGSITFDSKELKLFTDSDFIKIGFLPIGGTLINSLTVSDYFKFQRLWNYKNINFNVKLFDYFLSSLNMDEKYNTKIHKLSSGEKVKINFISSVCFYQKFLIYDEGFAFIDEKSLQIILSFIKSEKHNLCIIMASNHPEIISEIVDRSIILDH